MDAKALLFVDSRYWIQAEQQVVKDGWEVRRVGRMEASPPGIQGSWVDWLVKVSLRN
jgi:Xaa-Pro aminopeptidase